MDVNGSGTATALDALLVINYLNSHQFVTNPVSSEKVSEEGELIISTPSIAAVLPLLPYHHSDDFRTTPTPMNNPQIYSSRPTAEQSADFWFDDSQGDLFRVDESDPSDPDLDAVLGELAKDQSKIWNIDLFS